MTDRVDLDALRRIAEQAHFEAISVRLQPTELLALLDRIAQLSQRVDLTVPGEGPWIVQHHAPAEGEGEVWWVEMTANGRLHVRYLGGEAEAIPVCAALNWLDGGPRGTT